MKSKEPLFNLVKKDEKVKICVGNYLASPKDFDNYEDAEKYIASKPYELIINVSCIFMDFNHKQNETKKTLKKMHKAFKSYADRERKSITTLFRALSKSFALLIGVVVCISCGSTKVQVSKPAQGTCTTITVTTNNPITTNVEPNTNTKL